MASQDTQSAAPVHRFILLTDIVQSSRLAEQYPSQYESALGQHNQLVEQAVAERGGEVYKQTGDGYLVLFETAGACLDAALTLGESLGRFAPLAEDEPLLVRLALHAGELKPSGEEYFGPALNRVSRICQVCNPGQVLLSAAVEVFAGGAGRSARQETTGRAARATSTSEFQLIDLGLHHLRDLADPEQLYQLDSERFSRHEFPHLATLNNRPNNLVSQPNHFIGRERELKELAALLLDDTRLLSITAPGGYGKSRLAAQLCANLLHRFEQGVFMAYLAPVREAGDIPAALAAATGFQFYGNRDPQQQVLDYLREKQMLLCFDNFEHVLAGAPFIAEILREAPQVKLIVTSREPLRIAGEQVYALDPLEVQDGDQADGKVPEAVLLFADRASLVDASFVMDEQSRLKVRDICAGLDGIPLAIELAAAWVDSFSLKELAAELDRQLELTARLGDAAERHRSLRASLDWSWNLLKEERQRLLMQLATFRGGCFIEGAAAVVGMQGLALRREMAVLIDKSWLYTRESDGQKRFFLRDAASREYAFEKLAATRSEGADSLFEQAAMAHAQYFSELMAREGAKLRAAGQLEALKCIGEEKQDVFEALDTLQNRLADSSTATAAADILLPMLQPLVTYLITTSELQELVERFRPLVKAARGHGDEPRALLWALLGFGTGLSLLGQYAASHEVSEEALPIADAISDSEAKATALRLQAAEMRNQGDPMAATDLCEQSLAICRQIGDSSGIAAVLNPLGHLKNDLGEFDAAQEYFSQSLAIYREQGDLNGMAGALNNIGLQELDKANYSSAQELFSQALDINRKTGNRMWAAINIANLGNVGSMQGNLSLARELYEKAKAVFREVGDRMAIAEIYYSLGRLDDLCGDIDSGRENFDRALAMFKAVGNSKGIAAILNNFGIMENSAGNHGKARELFNRSLSVYRQLGNRKGIAGALHNLGSVARYQGNPDAARDLYNQALEINRETGNRRWAGNNLAGLGDLEYEAGNLGQARALYSDALALRQEIGDRSGVCSTLVAIGCLLMATNQSPDAAVCLYGAQHLANQLDYSTGQEDSRKLEEGLALIEHPETGLPAEERSQLKAQAEAMSLDELVNFALPALAKLKDVSLAGEADQQAGA